MAPSSTPSSSSQDGLHLQLLSQLFLHTFGTGDFTVFLKKLFQLPNAFPLGSFSCCELSPPHREYREKLDYFVAASLYVQEDYYRVLAQASLLQLFPVGHIFQNSHALYCSPQYLHRLSHFVLEAFPQFCLAAKALQVPIFSRVLFQTPYWCLLCFCIKNMACVCLFCNSRISLICPSFDLLETKITVLHTTYAGVMHLYFPR